MKIKAKAKLENQDDFSLAYTPDVDRICEGIAAKRDKEIQWRLFLMALLFLG